VAEGHQQMPAAFGTTSVEMPNPRQSVLSGCVLKLGHCSRESLVFSLLSKILQLPDQLVTALGFM
jgi:hypothetical protein